MKRCKPGVVTVPVTTASLAAALLVTALLTAPAARADMRPPYESEQGSHILGPGFQTLTAQGSQVQLPTLPGATLSVDNGQLKATNGAQVLKGAALDGAWLDGELVNGGVATAVRFLVEHGRPHVNVYDNALHGAWEYRVRWATTITDVHYLCDDGGYALVETGRWTSAGKYDHTPPSPYLSFACTPRALPGQSPAPPPAVATASGSVAAKCIDWGYAPWADPVLSGTTPANVSYAGASETSSCTTCRTPFDFHEACVRMAMADYCGGGFANTFDGTWIAMSDVLDVNNVLVAPGGGAQATLLPRLEGALAPFYFEAGWAPHTGAVCLSKKRWSTLPLDAFDPSDLATTVVPRRGCTQTNQLPDPRRFAPGEIKYCDDLGENNMELGRGALLFNYSTFIDVGLYQFANAGGALYAGTDVDVDAAGIVSNHYPALAHPGFTAMRYEGTLYSPAVDTWGVLPINTSFARLTLYSCNGHSVTTTHAPPAPPAGCGAWPASGTALGWLFAYDSSQPAPPGRPLLRLYRADASGDYMTTTMDLTGQPYTLVSSEGYLLFN